MSFSTNNETPNLVSYIKQNNIEGVRKLLQEGVDPNQLVPTNTGAVLPLFESVKSGNLNIVNLLLDKGADINIRNSVGYTALHAAIHRDNGPLIKLLLDRGIDPNIPGHKGENSLSFALDRQDRLDAILPSVIELLVQNDVDPNSPDQNNQTSLFYAVKRSNAPLIQFLLNNGANVNHLDNRRRNVLYYEIDSVEPSINIIKLLLDNGADPNNALRIAIIEEVDMNIIRLLIEKGANVNYVDTKGENILGLVLYTKPEIIRLMLDSGAIPNADNMKWVMGRNDLDTLRLFLAAGASPFVDEIICVTEECRREISEWRWDVIEENVERLARQYSKTGDFQLPREIWELILLRKRQNTYCANLNTDKYKYLLAFFAIYLEIPVTPESTKSDLCKLISKQLSFGGKYGEKSVKYLETVEGREKIFRTAMMLGIDPNQPFQNILDHIAIKLKI